MENSGSCHVTWRRFFFSLAMRCGNDSVYSFFFFCVRHGSGEDDELRRESSSYHAIS